MISLSMEVIGIGDVAVCMSGGNLSPPEFSPPLRVSLPDKIQATSGPPLRCGRMVQPSFQSAVYPRDDRNRQGDPTMKRLAQFLAATGRKLSSLGKVLCHFFRKGKLGLKLAIKIPFFVEIEISLETDWSGRL